MPNKLLVSVVDDDPSLRESLPDLLREFGFEVQAFASGESFLESAALLQTRCLILDVAMPGLSGPEVHEELTRRGLGIPTIFITAHADEFTRPHLLSLGASDCLFKPFSDTLLLAAIQASLHGS